MAVQRKLWILCCIGAVLALMVGSGLLTARAFGPEQKVVDPGKKWPLLVEPEVLNHWGKVTVFIPVHPIEDGALEAPAFLSNWEEAYGIAIDLDSPTWLISSLSPTIHISSPHPHLPMPRSSIFQLGNG